MHTYLVADSFFMNQMISMFQLRKIINSGQGKWNCYGSLYIFYIYLRPGILQFRLIHANISVLKRLIHLIHILQRKGCHMLFLDYQDRRPIYEQIVEKFRLLILSGAMEPDSRMPSVRQLAMELSINPNTIQRAYMELEQQGLIYPVKGRGSFVTGSSEIRRIGMEEILSELRETTEKCRTFGIEEEEIIHVIRECYKEGDND